MTFERAGIFALHKMHTDVFDRTRTCRPMRSDFQLRQTAGVAPCRCVNAEPGDRCRLYFNSTAVGAVSSTPLSRPASPVPPPDARGLRRNTDCAQTARRDGRAFLPGDCVRCAGIVCAAPGLRRRELLRSVRRHCHGILHVRVLVTGIRQSDTAATDTT